MGEPDEWTKSRQNRKREVINAGEDGRTGSKAQNIDTSDSPSVRVKQTHPKHGDEMTHGKHERGKGTNSQK